MNTFYQTYQEIEVTKQTATLKSGRQVPPETQSKNLLTWNRLLWNDKLKGDLKW